MERVLTPQQLDAQLLLGLVRRRDPAGVLTIYVDLGEARDEPAARAATIDVSNRLAELERRIEDEGPPARARALRAALRRLAPRVERLLDPRAAGRGRALFAWVDHPELISFSSQMRLPSRVVLDSSPFIHPLLELIDEGRPAGVILASDLLQ